MVLVLSLGGLQRLQAVGVHNDNDKLHGKRLASDTRRLRNQCQTNCCRSGWEHRIKQLFGNILTSIVQVGPRHKHPNKTHTKAQYVWNATRTHTISKIPEAIETQCCTRTCQHTCGATCTRTNAFAIARCPYARTRKRDCIRSVWLCVRARASDCVRACVRMCVDECACVRACVRVCV